MRPKLPQGTEHLAPVAGVAGGECKDKPKQTQCRTQPRGSGLRKGVLQPGLKETCQSLPHRHFPVLGRTERPRDETHGLSETAGRPPFPGAGPALGR